MKNFLLCVSFSIAATLKIQAQGCSDAGFCTIGAIKHETTNQQTAFKNKFRVMLANGLGDESVYVFTPALEYEHEFTKQWLLQARLTANYASGNLASVITAGDLIITCIKNKELPNNWKAGFNFSVKLPLSGSNARKNGLSLPMQYQGSLGTVDLIAGVTFGNNRWTFSAGWQQPLTGTNGNQFLPAYWGTNAYAAKYLPGNDFNRRSDVLLKATHNIVQGKWNVNVGLLGIYHTGNDTYIDGNISNKPVELNGSKGITLNVTAGIWYKSNEKITISINGGVPVVVRQIRPDGLTRQFVLSPQINYTF